MEPLVHIVTLNWQNGPLTAALLESLRRLRYDRFRVVVVDNGSRDDSVARLRAAFPEVEIIEAPRNLGFGAGNNLAIRRALDKGAGYVWLINNDAKPDPDALRAMVRAAEAEVKIGAVGSVIYDEGKPDSVQAWGGGTVAPWRGYARLAKRARESISYITGTSMLLRCEALRQAGLFDEQFFLYWEDAELCRRLRARGWNLAVASDSKVLHASSTTTGREPEARMYHIARGCVLYLRGHTAHPLPASVTALLFLWAGKLLRGNAAALRGIWSGWRSAWREPDPKGHGAATSATTRGPAVPTERVPECPLCGRPGRVLYEGLRDRACNTPGIWTIKACSDARCGLLWLDPRPTPSGMALTYQGYFTHEDAGLAGGTVETRGLLRRIVTAGVNRVFGLTRERATLALMFLDSEEPGDLLDVGCGSGRLLGEMAARGWKVQGVEPDPEAAARARRAGFTVHTGTLQEAPLPEGAFDAVALQHVIEHVHDPQATLAQCRRLLRPGGRLVLTTPNGAGLGHRRFGADWLALDPPRHLCLYSVHNLRAILKRAGFQAITLRTTAANAPSIYWASADIRAQGFHRLDDPAAATRHAWGALFYQISAALQRLGRPQSGDEIVAVARAEGGRP